MKGYKGFNKDFKCNDKQFEVGKEYATDDEKLKLCENGFHFCKYPLDVFKYYGYYGPASGRYAEIESTGKLEDDNPNDKPDTDSKVCTSKLKICKEIKIPDLADEAIKYIKENIDISLKAEKILEQNESDNYSISANTYRHSVAENSGDSSIAVNTGDNSIAVNIGSGSMSVNTGCKSAATNISDSSIAANTGSGSVSSNTGYCSTASNAGYCSISENEGESSVATNVGYRSVSTNIGYASAAINTGDGSMVTNQGSNSIAANTGHRGMTTNTGVNSIAAITGNRSMVSNSGINCIAASVGRHSAAVVTGENSVAVSIGYNGIAKGTIGNWIVLSEWIDDKKEKGNRVLKDMQCFKVDGIRILPNTFYKLKNGKPVVEDINEELKLFIEQ